MYRLRRVIALTVLLVAAASVPAWAGSGSYNSFAKSIEFFFGESAGDGKSKDFSGYGTAKLCADAPTGSFSNYNVTYRKNRTLQPDDILKERFLAYADAKYVSNSFSTTSSSKYHTDATWSYVSGLLAETKGYSKAVGSSC